MKATDGALIELARLARVRPPHIFHLIHYRKSMKDKFSPEGYAAFAQMELRHVLRMLEVLPDEVPKAKATRAAPLTSGFLVPSEWKLWAQTERGWTADVVDTVAAQFCDYWRANGKAMVDWQATWRNWVRRDRRDDGPLGQGAQEAWNEERQREYLARISR